MEQSIQDIKTETWEIIRETSRMFQEYQKENDKRAIENDKRAEENDRRVIENDRRVIENEKRFAGNEKQFAENAKSFQKYKEENNRRIAEMDKQLQATDKQLQATDQQIQATDKQLQATDKRLNKYFETVKILDRNWGKFVEALVEPSVAKLFQDIGILVVGSEQRKKRQIGGESIEIDILLVNGDTVIAVEVKTTLSVDDVNEHINKHLKSFKHFFPEYKDKTVYGAVAYIHVDEKADRYAYRQGLFVLAFMANNMVKIKNDAKFVPVVWE